MQESIIHKTLKQVGLAKSESEVNVTSVSFAWCGCLKSCFGFFLHLSTPSFLSVLCSDLAGVLIVSWLFNAAETNSNDVSVQASARVATQTQKLRIKVAVSPRQNTDIGPNSPSADPTTAGVGGGVVRSLHLLLWRRTSFHLATEAVHAGRARQLHVFCSLHI